MTAADLIRDIDTTTAILSHSASAAGFIILGCRWLYLEYERRRAKN